MISKFLYKLSANLKCRIILSDYNLPYLERYVLFRGLGFAVYLHRFVGPDDNRDLHDHPFESKSLMLSGGYTEKIYDPLAGSNVLVSPDKHKRIKPILAYKIRRPFQLLRQHPDIFHSIEKVKRNTWTLFLHGKKTRSEWSFLNPETLKEKKIDAQDRVDYSLLKIGKHTPGRKYYGYHRVTIK